MKKYISLCILAVALVVVGCVEKQPVREPSPADIACGVYFLPTDEAAGVNPVEYTVAAEDTEYTYYLGRTSAAGSITVNIINTSDPAFKVPSSVTFKDGEYTTTFTIGFTNVPPTNTPVKLAVEEAYRPLYGLGSPIFEGALNCLWLKLGKGQWADTWTQARTIVAVDVLKSAIPPVRYRFVNAYNMDALNADEWEDWIDPSLIPDYVEVTVNDPDASGTQYITWNKFWYLGLNYQAVAGQPIKAYLPSALGAEGDENSFVYASISDKLFQLVPYMYIDGLGGYGLQSVYATLPGGPDLHDLL